MALIIANQPVPLRLDDGDVVRVGTTRVTLDSVVYCFRDGATVEDIVQKFPSLDLGDTYAVVAFYLKNREAVDAYIDGNERISGALQKEVESSTSVSGIRDRLMARLKAT